MWRWAGEAHTAKREGHAQAAALQVPNVLLRPEARGGEGAGEDLYIGTQPDCWLRCQWGRAREGALERTCTQVHSLTAGYSAGRAGQGKGPWGHIWQGLKEPSLVLHVDRPSWVRDSPWAVGGGAVLGCRCGGAVPG